MTNRKFRKLHTPFQLVPKSTTLDDLQRPICTLLQKRCIFRTHHKNLKTDQYYSRQKCSLLILLSGNIRFMRTFAGIPWRRGVKRQWGCRQRQFSAFLLAISSETLLIRSILLYGNTQFSSAFHRSQTA